jgi:hypothetical protein
MEVLVLVLLAGLFSLVVGASRLLFRIVGRGPGHALRSLERSSRSLFGADGPPEELCRRLIEKHPELSPGTHGGLSFLCSGCRGRLDFISDRTEIRIDLDGRVQEGLEVSTATMMTRLAEDDPEAFRVRGSERLYRQMFADPELGRMLRDWSVAFEWTLGPAGFCLQIRALPGNEEDLWRWLNGAYALLQAVPGFGRQSFVRITAGTKLQLADSLCQVCGATLAQGQVVYCRRCITPHHEECWNYARQCSTFGCREREFGRQMSGRST